MKRPVEYQVRPTSFNTFPRFGWSPTQINNATPPTTQTFFENKFLKASLHELQEQYKVLEARLERLERKVARDMSDHWSMIESLIERLDETTDEYEFTTEDTELSNSAILPGAFFPKTGVVTMNDLYEWQTISPKVISVSPADAAKIQALLDSTKAKQVK